MHEWTFSRKIKNHIIYYSAQALLFLAGRLPRFMSGTAAIIIGHAGYLLAGRERTTAVSNIEKSSLELFSGPHRIVKNMFVHLAVSALELARIRAGRPSPEVVLYDEAKRALEQALGRRKGVIFITGHIGNWEIMARHLAGLGYPISTVASESYDPRFTRMIDEFRKSGGVETIFRSSPGSATAMLRALKRGGVLGFLVDQNTRVPSVSVPFLGRRAPTPAGPAEIALKTGSAVVIGTIRRTGPHSHAIDIEPVDVSDEDNPESLTALFSRKLSQRIMSAPEQWVWMHKRWND